MKKYLLVLIILCGTLAMKSQVVSLELDTVCMDCPSVGYNCIQLFANMTNANDRISTVYGVEGEPLLITTDCETCFYQDLIGANTGDAINCGLCGFFPGLCYDTWVTIGKECSTDPGGQIFTLSSPDEPWTPYCDTIEMSDIFGGAWFSTPDQINTQAGADLKILLGQFTTCGNLQGCINVQCFPNYSGPGSDDIVQTALCFSSEGGVLIPGCTVPEALNYNPNATLDNGFCLFECALTVDSNTKIDPSCSYGSNGQIDVDASGNQGILRYYLNLGDDNVSGDWTGLANGTYSILMEDERFNDPIYNPGLVYSCNTTISVTLNTLPVTFALGAGDAVSCSGIADGCNTSTATGGTGTMSFEVINCSTQANLLDGQGNPVVLTSPATCLLPGGSWKYEATDANGCTFLSNCVTITSPPALNVTVGSIDPATCSNTADGGVSLSWFGGTGDVDYTIDGVFYEANFITGLAAGTYIVTGTDSQGCMNNESFTVTAPTDVVVTATSDMTECFGSADGCLTGAATGGNAGPRTYSIDDETYTSAAQFCNLPAGTYIVYSHDSQGCEGSTEIEITQPTEVGVSLVPGLVSCNGGTDGTITAQGNGGTPGYEYSIDNINFGSFNMFDELAEGTYTIYVTDNNDCAGMDEVTVDQPDALEIVVDVTDVLCNDEEDGEIIVDVTGGTPAYSYYLDGQVQADNVISGLGADTYTVTVVDINECETETQVTITEPTALTISMDGSTDETTPGANNGTISITVGGGTGSYDYSWENANGDIVSDDQDPSGLAPGVYNVTVTDENGCEITLEDEVEIDNTVLEFINNISLTLNPNPTNGQFILSVSGLKGQRMTYELKNAIGQLIVGREVGYASNQLSETIDITNHSAGVYYLTVSIENTSKTLKVVKE